MLALYVGSGALIVALLWAFRMRRVNKAAYAAEPEHWLALSVDQFVLAQHTLGGIFVVRPLDRYRRGGRIACALLNMCVQLVVVTLLPFIRPDSFASTGFAPGKLLDALLGAMLAMVLSLVVCLPAVRWGASSLDGKVRRMAVLIGMMGIVVLLLVSAGIIFVLLRLNYVRSPLLLLVVYLTTSFASLVVVEPVLLLFRFFVFAETHIAVCTEAERVAGAAVSSKSSQVAPLADASATSITLVDASAQDAAPGAATAPPLLAAQEIAALRAASALPAEVRRPSRTSDSPSGQARPRPRPRPRSSVA